MKSLKRVFLMVGLAGLLLWIGLPASAQNRNSCADDIAEFCKDVSPGGGRMARCLKQHEEDLSEECKASIEQARSKVQEAQEACSDDIQNFCKDVKPGAGRIMRCLKKNEEQLSAECRETLKKSRKKRE